MVRTLSALILAPVVLAAVYVGEMLFHVLIAVALVAGLWEWLKMCRRTAQPDKTSSTSVVWLLGGAGYIIAAMGALVWLRSYNEQGDIILFWLLGLVWAADTGAYLTGSTLGGPKFAPRISPNKTWSGFIGAIIFSTLVGWVTGYILGKAALDWDLILISSAIGAVSQMGDLLESFAKRHFGVKDSGTIIPGHGGILDRIDGLMAAAICAALVLYLNTGVELSWG